MEELAKLEEERGNPAYLNEAGNTGGSRREGERWHGGTTVTNAGGTTTWTGKKERVASNEMCTFLILNIFFFAINSGEYDCLQATVWQRESGRNYWTGDYGNIYEYDSGGSVLQDEG